MSKKRKYPLPWSVRGISENGPDVVIVDRWGNYVMQYLNPNTARMIVDAVNHFHQPATEARRTAGEPGANTEPRVMATRVLESPPKGAALAQPSAPTNRRKTTRGDSRRDGAFLEGRTAAARQDSDEWEA